jgi:hypothetical protein
MIAIDTDRGMDMVIDRTEIIEYMKLLLVIDNT